MAQTDFVSRGQDLVNAGQYQEAVKVCRLGLLARPGEVDGRLVLGSALLALRRYDEVLAEMRVALELEASNAGAYQLRGEALLRKGDPHAAVETLERARKLAGGDPAIAGLLEEARLAQAAAGPPAFADGDQATKHYPTHRGGESSGSGRSGSFTKPVARRRAATDDRTPSPETLRVGDKSGTVELDPELEGVEYDDDDELAEVGSTSSVEVDDADLLELDDDDDDDDRRLINEQTRAGRPQSRTPRPVATGPEPGRAGAPPGRPSAARTAQWGAEEVSDNPTRRKIMPITARDDDAATRPRSFVDDDAPPRAPIDPRGPRSRQLEPVYEEESSLSGRSSHPRLAELSAGPLGGLTPAPVMTPSGRFLSAPSGPGAALGGPAPVFAPPSGPIISTAHAPTVAGAVPLSPTGTPPGMSPPLPGPAVPTSAAQARTVVPFTAAAVRPTVAMSAAEVPSVSGPPGPDMDMIRAGVHVPPLDYPSVSQTPLPPGMSAISPGRAPSTRTSRMALRSPWMLAVWVSITVAIIGGGVFAGFKIRDMRLAKQIAAARRGAEQVARADTWTGWRSARERLAAINRARSTAGNRAALAKASAILGGVYGDDLPGARAAVEALGGDRSRDAALARAYVAIGAGDGKAAADAIADAGGADGDPELALAASRAAVVDGRWDVAASTARRAADRDPRPAAYATLCIAETARRRIADAERACAEAERLQPGHPAAVIARARLAVVSGRARTDAAALRTALEAVTAEATRPVAEQRLGVAPFEEAWAELALAEVAVAAGDLTKARVALERVRSGEREDRRLIEAEATLDLGLGDTAAANRLVEQGLARWPTSPALLVARAAGLIAASDLVGAAAALAKIDPSADSPAVALARARVAFASGDLDEAAKLLDGLLAKRGDDIDALVARAELDLARGEPGAARDRLESSYSAQAAPALIVTYAAALRLDRRWNDARVALERVTTTGAAGPDTGRAWLELARVARDSGDAKEAATAYSRAQELLPKSRDASLESAVLKVDDGDAVGGLASLRKLLEGYPTDATIMVEAARASVFTGDLGEAQRLLDLAAAAASPPPHLARERGRLALRQRDLTKAEGALRDAVTADPRDFDAWMLLLDAQLVSSGATNDPRPAKAVADEILKKFPERQDLGLVTGRIHLVEGRLTEAATTFLSLRSPMQKAPRRAQADLFYWIGVAQYYKGEPPNALFHLEKAVEQEPAHADAQGMLGHLYLDLGRNTDAIKALERATSLDPDNTSAAFDLGRAYLAARRLKDGRAALERYLERWPQGPDAEQVRALLGR